MVMMLTSFPWWLVQIVAATRFVDALSGTYQQVQIFVLVISPMHGVPSQLAVGGSNDATPLWAYVCISAYGLLITQR